MQMDDARAQGDYAEHTTRFGRARNTCRQLTSRFVLQMEPELTRGVCGQLTSECVEKEKPERVISGGMGGLMSAGSGSA